MKKFDLIVIGGGTGGINVLRAATAAGWKVALIEAGHMGGTCINVGCIPSKTLLYSARVLQEVREAEKYGVITDAPKADWKAMVKRKDDLVGRIRNRSYKNVQRDENVTLYEGEAEFAGEKQVSINGEKITADKILIAAGSRSDIPPLPEIEKTGYFTSTSIMDTPDLPRSILIMGGGIIGVEFSQLLIRLGVEVTVLQRNTRLAPALEPEISAEIGERLKEEGLKIVTGVDIREVGRDGDTVYAVDHSGEKPVRYRAEKLLLATGRAPNSDRLKVESIGMETDEKGFIRVDSSFKTSVEGIWAVGDIVGGLMFTHRARHDAMLLARHLVEGEKINNEGRLIPYAIFTEPEIAAVGLGEEAAVNAGYRVKVQRFPFAYHGRALAVLKTDGYIKLVIDKESGKILGAHIIGPEAAELLHELITAMHFGATIYDLQEIMHIHPTLAEAIQSAAWSK
jgi:dihydrolipoamide dehydrogenase